MLRDLITTSIWMRCGATARKPRGAFNPLTPPKHLVVAGAAGRRMSVVLLAGRSVVSTAYGLRRQTTLPLPLTTPAYRHWATAVIGRSPRPPARRCRRVGGSGGGQARINELNFSFAFDEAGSDPSSKPAASAARGPKPVDAATAHADFERKEREHLERLRAGGAEAAAATATPQVDPLVLKALEEKAEAKRRLAAEQAERAAVAAAEAEKQAEATRLEQEAKAKIEAEEEARRDAEEEEKEQLEMEAAMAQVAEAKRKVEQARLAEAEDAAAKMEAAAKEAEAAEVAADCVAAGKPGPDEEIKAAAEQVEEKPKAVGEKAVTAKAPGPEPVSPADDDAAEKKSSPELSPAKSEKIRATERAAQAARKKAEDARQKVAAARKRASDAAARKKAIGDAARKKIEAEKARKQAEQTSVKEQADAARQKVEEAKRKLHEAREKEAAAAAKRANEAVAAAAQQQADDEAAAQKQADDEAAAAAAAAAAQKQADDEAAAAAEMKAWEEEAEVAKATTFQAGPATDLARAGELSAAVSAPVSAPVTLQRKSSTVGLDPSLLKEAQALLDRQEEEARTAAEAERAETESKRKMAEDEAAAAVQAEVAAQQEADDAKAQAVADAERKAEEIKAMMAAREVQRAENELRQKAGLGRAASGQKPPLPVKPPGLTPGLDYAGRKFSPLKKGESKRASMTLDQVLAVAKLTGTTIDMQTAEEVDDLAKLTKLDDPILCDQLHRRYDVDKIYTYVGDILVAVNPFKDLPIYDRKHQRDYVTLSRGALAPHIYALAEAAHMGMVHSKDRQSQCLLVSGESGAGKTESAKYLMRQLMLLCSVSRDDSSANNLERKIISVNPLLEAFGNAMTEKNDNSSRFGKYTELVYDLEGNVLGSDISIYLLEKSRVTAPGGAHGAEQNFHMFYYMFHEGVAPASLGLGSAEDYQLLSNIYGISYDADEESPATEVLQAMMDVGFEKPDQEVVWKTLAAVLHIGQLAFADDGAWAKIAPGSEKLFRLIGTLLGLDEQVFRKALLGRWIYTPGEQVWKTYSVSEAESCALAMARALYGKLFHWIVLSINQLLCPPPKPKAGRGCSAERRPTIGILDIFGFEDFRVNSFEQLCINLANEQLQFFFNEHVFLLEQLEYKKEGVSIDEITYVDNKPLLDMHLLPPPSVSLFALLDEESLLKSGFRKASPTALVDKFREQLNSFDCYIPAIGSAPEFTIVHYAGEVLYQANDFVEKNRDALQDDVIVCLQDSSEVAVAEMFVNQVNMQTGAMESAGTRGDSLAVRKERVNRAKTVRKTAKKRPVTTGAQFRVSLKVLYDKMSDNCRPHFVRCIKPNTSNRRTLFEDDFVMAQLKYTGMLATTRIRREGFAIRPHFEEFIKRFRVLGFDRADEIAYTAENCRVILESAGISECHLGKTKVFLKHYQMDELEARLVSLAIAATMVQKWYRGFVERREHKVRLKMVSVQAKWAEDFLSSATAHSAEFSGAVAKQRAEDVAKEDARIAEIEAARLEAERVAEEAEQMRIAEAKRLAEVEAAAELLRQEQERARIEEEMRLERARIEEEMRLERARVEEERAAQRRAQKLRQEEERLREEEEARRMSEEAFQRETRIKALADDIRATAARRGDLRPLMVELTGEMRGQEEFMAVQYAEVQDMLSQARVGLDSSSSAVQDAAAQRDETVDHIVQKARVGGEDAAAAIEALRGHLQAQDAALSEARLDHEVAAMRVDSKVKMVEQVQLQQARVVKSVNEALAEANGFLQMSSDEFSARSKQTEADRLRHASEQEKQLAMLQRELDSRDAELEGLRGDSQAAAQLAEQVTLDREEAVGQLKGAMEAAELEVAGLRSALREARAGEERSTAAMSTATIAHRQALKASEAEHDRALSAERKRAQQLEFDLRKLQRDFDSESAALESERQLGASQLSRQANTLQAEMAMLQTQLDEKQMQVDELEMKLAHVDRATSADRADADEAAALLESKASQLSAARADANSKQAELRSQVMTLQQDLASALAENERVSALEAKRAEAASSSQLESAAVGDELRALLQEKTEIATLRHEEHEKMQEMLRAKVDEQAAELARLRAQLAAQLEDLTEQLRQKDRAMLAQLAEKDGVLGDYQQKAAAAAAERDAVATQLKTAQQELHESRAEGTVLANKLESQEGLVSELKAESAMAIAELHRIIEEQQVAERKRFGDEHALRLEAERENKALRSRLEAANASLVTAKEEAQRFVEELRREHEEQINKLEVTLRERTEVLSELREREGMLNERCLHLQEQVEGDLATLKERDSELEYLREQLGESTVREQREHERAMKLHAQAMSDLESRLSLQTEAQRRNFMKLKKSIVAMARKRPGNSTPGEGAHVDLHNYITMVKGEEGIPHEMRFDRFKCKSYLVKVGATVEQRRWVVLDLQQKTLSWYVDDRELRISRKGQFALADMVKVVDPGNKDTQMTRAFMIGITNRTYTFIAETVEVKHCWMQVFMCILGQG